VLLWEPWSIELFGGVRVHNPHLEHTRFRTQKTACLLAYLAHFGKPVSREALVERFWPDADLEAGRASLRNSLTSLRHQLEPPGVPGGSVLVAERNSIQLNPDGYRCDSRTFLQQADSVGRSGSAEQQAHEIGELLDSIHGEFMPGYFDDWVVEERLGLEIAQVQLLDRLVKLLAHQKDFERGVKVAQRSVKIDPLNEAAHRRLIWLLAAMGRTSEALSQFEVMQKILQDDLKSEPSAKSRQLVSQIKSGQFDIEDDLELGEGLAESVSKPSVPATPEPAQPLRSLPKPLTRFFGREQELNELREWWNSALETSSRLLTLTGPGGSGKTRLALEFARLSQMSGVRVAFAPLVDVARADLVPEAFATALGLQVRESSDLWPAIARMLSGERTMVVLDNLEQVVEGGAQAVRQLLDTCPETCVIVTSRVLLRIEGEQELPVRPLPTPTESANAEHLFLLPSVQVFADRARRVRADFQITPRNASTIAEITRRLEGVPLALELAAAWAQTLSPSQMLERMDAPFDFLVSNRRDIAERHRSLRATISWSINGLDAEAQRFFRKLGVFRGGWNLDAAIQVTQDRDAPAILDRLVSASIIFTETKGDSIRFRMLESLREFANEQLVGEERLEAEEQLQHYVLDLLRNSGQRIVTGKGNEAILILEAEHDNIRRVFDRAIERGDAAVAQQIVGECWRLWVRRGYLLEGLSRGRIMMEISDLDAPNSYLALGLHGLGNLYMIQGEYDEGTPIMQMAITMRRQLGERENELISMNSYGLCLVETGRFAEAETHFNQCLEMVEELSAESLRSMLTGNLAGTIWHQGRLDEAIQLYGRMISMAKASGVFYWETSGSANLGAIYGQQGRFEESLNILEFAIDGFKQAEDKHGQGYAHVFRAWTYVFMGDAVGAQRSNLESMIVLKSVPSKRLMAHALESIAGQLWIQGKTRGAAECSIAATDIRTRFGIDRSPADIAAYQRYFDEPIAALSPEERMAAENRACGLTLAEATDFAFGWLSD
jgi:predicted ATPase/DNA-binding SARP family transcriptional activator